MEDRGPGERTAALVAEVDRLEAALEAGGDAVPTTTADAVREVLRSTRERLRLGVDHTVVALAGGTGSGKSSLFNAISQLTFAEVGVRRPTTSEVTACVWAHDASALLDWLGVGRGRRIERESLLDGESQADLRGLVLLDLPDHDSVEPAHRAVVDRLVPLADLLVWVVDPQKYADDALHTGYLRRLVGHEASMAVVLNQVDTVPAAAREAIRDDVVRLLRADGLDDVRVLTASARTGDGVPEVRAELARSVAGRGVAERRVAAELDDAARALAATAGPGEPARTPVDASVDGLAAALGVPGTVDQVRAWTRPGTGPVITWGRAQRERVEEVREHWVTTCAASLPEAWADRLDREVATVATLAGRSESAVDGVTPEPLRARGRSVTRVLAWVLGVAALVALGVAAGVVAGAGGWTDTGTLLVGAGAALLVAAVVAALTARALGRRAAARRAAGLDDALRTALREVVDEGLAVPTDAVLAAHRAVRTCARPA